MAQNFASGATLASQRGQVRDGDSTVMGQASYSRATEGTTLIEAIVCDRGSNARIYKSALVFVAAASLAPASEEAWKAIAIESVANEAELVRRLESRNLGALWTLIGPVSCISCVSSWHWVNTAETHETVY